MILYGYKTIWIQKALKIVENLLHCLIIVVRQIADGIDTKYLKPPLGETEEMKKERVKEMIEVAKASQTAEHLGIQLRVSFKKEI